MVAAERRAVAPVDRPARETARRSPTRWGRRTWPTWTLVSGALTTPVTAAAAPVTSAGSVNVAVAAEPR